MSGNDQIAKLNALLVTKVVLPALSERLGEEFAITVRRLTGKHIQLFENMPQELVDMRDNPDADKAVNTAMKTFPWLKKIVMAAVVTPKIVDKPIGDHAPDELSVDALEGDLVVIVNNILRASGLTADEEEGQPAIPFRDSA